MLNSILFGLLSKTLLLMCLSINMVHAVDPPEIVYRIDSRSPSVIFFSGGFAAWGQDQDILRHITGESINDETSGFVSTTSDMYAVDRMAVQQLSNNPSDTWWVYDITPSINFYNMPNSLIDTAMSSDNEVQRHQVMAIYNVYAWQEEWIATGSIHPNQIYSARAITLTDGGVVYGPRTLNPNYTNPLPVVNPNTIPSHNYGIVEAYFAETSSSLSPMSVSFSAGSCNGSSPDSGIKKNVNPTCEEYRKNFDTILQKFNLILFLFSGVNV